jgi:hypothetical protein
MFAALLTHDDSGNADVEVPLADDSSVVEEHVRSLNGDRRTLVTLIGGEAHLAVGGGDAGFVVYATFDNETFHTLVSPDAAAGEVEVVAGGQPGVYERRQVVSLEMALRAAKAFAETGTLAPGLTWVES